MLKFKKKSVAKRLIYCTNKFEYSTLYQLAYNRDLTQYAYYILWNVWISLFPQTLKSRVGFSTSMVGTVWDGFPCFLEMVLLRDFPENMSFLRVILPVPYQLGQTLPEWFKLSERWYLRSRNCNCQHGFSLSLTDGVIWVFLGDQVPWTVVGTTHKRWRCANISTWR